MGAEWMTSKRVLVESWAAEHDPVSSSEIINLAVALWGAITGTVAITLSVLTWMAERPRLRLEMGSRLLVVRDRR
jgi:hypothetical protein